MFANITTLDELKKAYRAAAMHAHPGRAVDVNIKRPDWDR